MNELTHTDQRFIFVARPVCIPMACRRLQLCSLTLERLCEQTLLSHNRPPGKSFGYMHLLKMSGCVCMICGDEDNDGMK